MNVYVVAVEYSLAKPDPLLGDESMCPLFRRVSSRCPVLHLFGYFYTRRQDGDMSHGANPEVLGTKGEMNDLLPRTICVHVHGVYPYFMVLQHDPKVSPMQFGAQLETVAIKALKLSSSSSAEPPQVLHHVELLQRLPFYGYHARPMSFYKVSVVDPAMVKKLSHLLCCTTQVGGRRWQTYEAHASYHFQFMVDYGLKGMAPFCIPTCTARAPVPGELRTTEAQSRFCVSAVMPIGEPLRLTRAELEVDVAAAAFCRLEAPMEAGENLLSVRRGVREYFAEFGVSDAVRRAAVCDTCVRDCGVCDVQDRDPAVAVMRRQALAHLRARAKTVATPIVPHMAVVPRENAGNTPSSLLFSDTADDNFTLQLMAELLGDCAGPAPPPFSFSNTSSSESFSASPGHDGKAGVAPEAPKSLQESCGVFSPLALRASPRHADDVIEDEGECSLFSSEDGSVQEVLCSGGTSFVVGDSIALCNVHVDGDTPHPWLLAKITEINSCTVRLRWYMKLHETHLADCQNELEKSGRWLAKGMIDASGMTSAVEEELLLGDVEDENPRDVLKHSFLVIVRHSYRDCKRSELLCRYNYHVFEKRLSKIDSGLDNNDDDNANVVVFPSMLCSSASDDIKAETVGEDEVLFTTSSSSASSLSSSSSLLISASETRASSPPLPPAAEVAALTVANSPSIAVQRSVSKTQQKVEQSQLSLLLSSTALSPPACSQVSLPKVSHAGAASGLSLSSSVECVDLRKETLLQECRTKGFHLQPCCFMDDVSRCFRWTYDQHRNHVVVSAASWPFATPVVSAFSSTSASSAPAKTVMVTSTLKNTARPSVPLLTHVAISQATPLGFRYTPSVKEKRQPQLSLNTSHSVDRCAYLTCALRVMCVEVLIHRRYGERNVAQESLLAVALGRTTSAAETVGVRLLCVCPPKTAMSRMRQPFSGTIEVVHLPSESHLLRRVRCEVRCYDPDIILSWEGLKYGVGLFALRYRTVLQRSFARDFSRFFYDSNSDNHIDSDDDKKWVMEERNDDEEMDSCASDEELLSVSSASEDGGNPFTSDLSSRVTAPHFRADDMVKRVSRRFGNSLHVAGRIVISLGRQLRKELKLPSHTLQMVYQKLFHRSLPYFTDGALSKMYTSGEDAMRRVALSVLLTRVVTPHRIAQHLNFYTRTTEFSRMYGILFHEVLSRGSQYRVEATLQRMARPMGYAMLSPPIEQVHTQPRLEGIPLIMQPRSGFYNNDPVVVLDFRSLYPSIVIAYNLCYTTCLGKVSKHRRCRLGVVTSYEQADSLLLPLLEADDACTKSRRVIIAPNGCMFLAPAEREGVLPKMLRALLETRLEVLAALNHVAQPHEDVHMQRVLHEQQAAIKMLANTTYGYTAASFTGRMPCVDVADAILMLGRQTLERAVQLINGHPKWNADVVYGDTDSLFVRLPGRTKEEAFVLGEQIAKDVTAINPAPIQLKFEKVFLPCLLLVKKRYVGYAYFKPDQEQPQFFAKGIETVRREQCPATARLAASMIHALFSGASTEALRVRFCEEVSKLLHGECNPVDCIFRRSVKLGKYCQKKRLPAAAHLAVQLMRADITRTPYWGERLPYIVVQSMESTRLCDQVVHPQRLLSIEENLRVDTEYYIKRHIIPTLDRMFHLIGVSCASWYAAMPRRRPYRTYFDLGVTERPLAGKKRPRTEHNSIVVDVDAECDAAKGEHLTSPFNVPYRVKRKTLDAYYQQMMCAVCFENSTKTTPPNPPICASCFKNRAASVTRVIGRRRDVERHLRLLETACQRCIGSCGEAGGPNFVAGLERDMEDMHFAIPHHLAAATVHGEEADGCVSIDCSLSFEKRHVFLLYSQLMALERYITRL